MSEDWLEVIMPVRNAGAAIEQTVASLRMQTDREFGVLISDNYSSVGRERLDAARITLENGGVRVRLLRPPLELGRVEHWNWAHHASNADWLKPLFVGDTLAPEYVSLLRRRVAARPAARLLRCAFEVVTPERKAPAAEPPVDADRFSPTEFLQHFPQRGNWLGGPINFAYERTAFRGAGGYSTQLPAVADLHLFVTLALRHGMELIPECLATFHLHEQRFSHGITRRRVNGVVELWLILRQARNFCLENKLPWPEAGVRAGTWRQVKLDYWDPQKQALKRWLGLHGSRDRKLR